MNDEDTLPPLRSQEEREERDRLRPLAIVAWLLVILAFGAIIALHGCASVPKCPEARAFIAQAEGLGLFYGFTPEALAEWTNAIRLEAQGKCQFEKKGEV